jgi:hypothetical protein
MKDLNLSTISLLFSIPDGTCSPGRTFVLKVLFLSQPDIYIHSSVQKDQTKERLMSRLEEIEYYLGTKGREG